MELALTEWAKKIRDTVLWCIQAAEELLFVQYRGDEKWLNN